MSRHTTYLRDPVAAHSFRELHDRYPDLPGAGRALILDSYGARAQEACWAGVRERADAHIEGELMIDRQREERWCPRCRDRRTAHEPGDCPKYKRTAHGRPTSSSTSPSTQVRFDHDDPLKSIPAPEYLPALAGVEVSSSGRCRCPLPDHVDEHPSAKCYGTRWRCFSCGASGSIIDVGAALYGIDPSGRGYWEIRDRLIADLGGRA